MRKLLSYLKLYRKEAILGPLFKLLEASFELLIPLVVANIIDVGIAENNQQIIIRDAVLMAALGLIGMLFAITAQYFSAKAAVGLAATIRHELFSHIQSLSYSKAQTVGTSTLLTRITSDVNQVQTGLNLSLRLLLRSPFIVFGAMIMAFTVNVRAALIFVMWPRQNRKWPRRTCPPHGRHGGPRPGRGRARGEIHRCLEAAPRRGDGGDTGPAEGAAHAPRRVNILERKP